MIQKSDHATPKSCHC